MLALSDKLNIETSFTEQLPADSVTDSYQRQVEAACYSFVKPTQVRDPKLIAFSQEMASN